MLEQLVAEVIVNTNTSSIVVWLDKSTATFSRSLALFLFFVLTICYLFALMLYELLYDANDNDEDERRRRRWWYQISTKLTQSLWLVCTNMNAVVDECSCCFRQHERIIVPECLCVRVFIKKAPVAFPPSSLLQRFPSVLSGLSLGQMWWFWTRVLSHFPQILFPSSCSIKFLWLGF